MKQIRVRYFAMFREQAGLDEEVLELDADTAQDVFAAVRGKLGTDEPQGHCKVAVNDQMADWDTTVNDGDTVLLFPPVAGG